MADALARAQRTLDGAPWAVGGPRQPVREAKWVEALQIVVRSRYERRWVTYLRRPAEATEPLGRTPVIDAWSEVLEGLGAHVLDARASIAPCRPCRASGAVECTQCAFDRAARCEHCGGVREVQCDACDGSGKNEVLPVVHAEWITETVARAADADSLPTWVLARLDDPELGGSTLDRAPDLATYRDAKPAACLARDLDSDPSRRVRERVVSYARIPVIEATLVDDRVVWLAGEPLRAVPEAAKIAETPTGVRHAAIKTLGVTSRVATVGWMAAAVASVWTLVELLHRIFG